MRKILIVIALLAAVTASRAAESGADDPRIDVHMRTAQGLFNSGHADKAIKEAQRALKLDKRYAPAYLLMARAYMRMNTPRDRSRAEDAIRKAIEIEPDNAGFHIAYADLMLAQDFRENAKKYLETARNSAREPEEILRKLAGLYADDYVRLKDLVSSDQFAVANTYIVSKMAGRGYDVFQAYLDQLETAPPIEFGGFAREELEKAAGIYGVLDSMDFAPAGFQRDKALLAYHAGDWRGMARDAERWVREDPHNGDAWLLLGLAYQRASFHAEADSAFGRFRDLTHRHDRTHLDFFDRFLSPGRQMEIQNMMAYELERFHRSFWQSRDPLYLTEYNERLLEHYARVAEAGLLFGNPRGAALDGWKTDRGNIWVRYGPPERIIRNLNLEAGQEMRNERSADLIAQGIMLRNAAWSTRRHNPEQDQIFEYWFYDTFSFIFNEFPAWSGNVRFASLPNFNAAAVSERLERTAPDAYRMKLEGKRIIFPVKVLNFKGSRGKSKVLILYEFPLSGFLHRQSGDRFVGRFRQGTFLHNEYWNLVQREIREMESAVTAPVDSSAVETYPAWNSAEVSPGGYHLAVEVMDGQSANAGAVHIPISVESYSGDSLRLSDILLADGISSSGGITPGTADSMGYLPNVNGVFAKGGNICLYFEIYNLHRAGAPPANGFSVQYAIEHRMARDNGTWNPFAYVGRLFKLSEGRYKVASSANYSGDSAEERMYLEIDPKTLPEGRYKLTLSVRDEAGNAEVHKETEFDVMQ